MRINGNAILLLVVLLADFTWLALYSNEMFSIEGKLGLFVSTRIGILALGIYLLRKTKNWLYIIGTMAYLLFSFIGVSLLYISFNSAAIG